MSLSVSGNTSARAISMGFDETIERQMIELRKIGPEYAKAYAQKEYLEEFKRSKIAILCKQAEQNGHSSYAAQEREARAHPDYLHLLEGLRDATERAESLRWQLEAAKIATEVWRSVESSRRAEKQGYRA